MTILMASIVNAALRFRSPAPPLPSSSLQRGLTSASNQGDAGALLVSSFAESTEVPPVPSFAPLKVDVEPVSDSTTPSTLSSSTASIIYGTMEAAACIIVLVSIYVLYKKKWPQRKPATKTSSHKDYRSYHLSPFSSGRFSREASSRAATEVDEGHLAISVSGACPSTFPALPFDDDELSTSYRTCSRVFSERLSSEYSWAMASDRSIRTTQSDVAAEQTANKPVVHTSEHNRLVFCRLSMAHEDTLSKYNEIEMSDISSIAEDRSARSSQIFSTFIESERSSAVSWTLGSSWSGSEISSLESVRATDVTLSECSASSSRSVRGTDEFEKEENSVRADIEKRPALTMGTEKCDSILLFKPIKPCLLALKLKKATAPQESAHEPQVFYC